MKLADLNLNRFLYKDNSNASTDNVLSSLSAQIQNYQSGISNIASPSAPQVQATGVAPNTVLPSSFFQSSPSSFRIEISPVDNSFRALDNYNRVIVLIDPTVGIVAQYEQVQLSNIKVLSISDYIAYRDTIFPMAFIGNVNGTSGSVVLLNATSSWAGTKNSTGDYTVTHNFGNTDYDVSFTPTPSGSTTGVTIQMYNISANSFSVLFLDVTDSPKDSDFRFSFQGVPPNL